MSPLGQIVFDEAGAVLRHNAALAQMLGPLPGQLRDTAPEFRLLLGWPGELPAVAATRTQDGWLANAAGEPLRVRVRVRGVPAGGGRARRQRHHALDRDARGSQPRGRARRRARRDPGVDGHRRHRRRHLGRRARLGRLGAARRARRRARTARRRSPTAARQGSLMAVGRDLVEAESMADYERLQAALRTRSRIEVRYAVRHHESGRRWLMTRVEPAELGPQRGAFSVVTVDVTEEETARRRNQDLLTELTTILDVSPAGIAYLRGEELVRCNHRFETLLGGSDYPPGKPFDEILASAGVPAETVAALIDAVRDVGTLETELLLPAGTHRRSAIWCTLALRRTHETAPGAIGMVVVLADATRMKSQQSELEALARERELMFNLSDVGIVYQRDGQIERANQAMADLVGYAPEALEGFADVAAVRERGGLAALRAPARRATWPRSAARTASARCGGATARCSGPRSARGRWPSTSRRRAPSCPSSTSTTRQRARESLVQQADRTRAILDSVLVGIVTVGDAGIEWMNRSARRMFGGELADFVGAPISVVAGDELDHPLRRTDYGETLEEGQAETFECRLRARDGRHFWVVGNVVVTGQDTAQPPAHLRTAGHRTPPPGRGQHRAGARQPAAHHRDRAAGHRAVRRRQPAGGAAEPDGRHVRGPADEGDPRPRAVAVAARARGREAVGRPAPRARHAGQRAARASAQRRRAATEGEGAHSVWDIRIVSLRSAADAPDQLLMVASDVTAQRAADEARLAAAIAQREMLIKEVHHRIKNNLQGVAGLLQQSASRHPEAAGAIAEAVSQVHAIAQVHGLQVGVTGPMRVRGVVEAIAASVQRMFGRTIHVEVSGPAAAPLRADRGRFDPDRADRQRAVHQRDQAQRAGRGRGGRPTSAAASSAARRRVVIAIANQGALAPASRWRASPRASPGWGWCARCLPRKGAGWRWRPRAIRWSRGWNWRRRR